MKKTFYIAMISLMLLSAAGCGNSNSTQTNTGTESASDTGTATASNEEIYDVDLTKLSSTMVYSEVSNMMSAPDAYIGKKVKMNGSFAVYQDPDTNKFYYACLIEDATACCSQGIEFVLDGSYSYPNDYPEINSEITITGIFDTYEEDGYVYCQLIDAKMDM